MKITVIMMMVALMQVSAASFGQKVTLKENRVSLDRVFKEMMKQTGYDIFLSAKNINLSTKINVDLNNVPLSDAIEKVLAGLPLTYSIEDKIVVVKEIEKSIIAKLGDYFSSIDVSGRVVDEKGNPIAGVTVKVKGTGMASSTSESGVFTLKNVDEKAVLEFSYLGYQTRELKALKDLGTVRLEIEVGKLEEITVNAGYYKVKERELTGSIARITAKDIEKQPVTNILATMQGRMAGVQVIQDGGMAGGAFQIKIRGQNSLRADGNQPLFIIDGAPYSSETIGAVLTQGSSSSLTSPLNSINPADVESIEVLKDADATAIYGSRGANGVVLITTKKGKSGKTLFSLNSSTSRGKVTKMMELMNTEQYLAMRRQAFANDGITNFPTAAYDVNGRWDVNRYTDWQKELIGGTVEVNSLQASVSGGSSRTQYLLSANKWSETTVYSGDFKYKKSGVHFSMNHLSEDERFQMSFSSSYSAQNNTQPQTDLTRISRILAPNAPSLYDSGGNLNWEGGTWQNPLASFESKFGAKTNDLNAGANLSYKILPNLYIKTNFGFNDLRNLENMTQPSTMYNPALGLTANDSALNTNRTLRTSWITEPQIKWDIAIGEGKMEVLVGSTFQGQTTNRLFQSGFGFSSNSLLYDLASAKLKVVEYSDELIYKYQALFGRLNYNWKDKYIVNLTGRRDGSSRFGPGKQFTNFGAIGAAWIFSKEAFFHSQSVLSFGKLRTSYGVTGNDQIGDYQYLDTYLSSGNAYQGVIGLQPTRLFNPAFGWESNRKFEMAMETGFFKDRIFLTTSFYLNRSSNQLVGIPLPGTTGFATLSGNLGATVQNTGLEVTLKTTNFTGRKFSWTTDFNISTNRNKLLAYPNLATSSNANIYVVGQSISMLKRYHYTGINAQNGAYSFQDVNGDGLITTLNDRERIIDLFPRFFGGLQNQFLFNGIQFDFLLQFVKQQVAPYAPGLPGLAVNQLKSVNNFWTSSNDDAKYQKLSSGTNSALNTAYSRYNQSDAAVEDASFIRLKNVSLAYQVPVGFVKGIQFRVFLQGQNLLTITPFKSGDPEFKFLGSLPPLRVYQAGLQLNFN